MKRVFTFLMVLSVAISMVLSPEDLFAEAKPDSAGIPVESKLSLSYLCCYDTVVLTATLSIKKEDRSFALENAPVDFIASNGTICKLLGTSKTDQEGNAVYKVTAAGLPADKEGMIYYSAKFTGKDKNPSAEASFKAKPAKIRLFFNIEDSLRILKVTATQKNEKGAEVAIPKENVIIYIPRLFSY